MARTEYLYGEVRYGVCSIACGNKLEDWKWFPSSQLQEIA